MRKLLATIARISVLVGGLTLLCYVTGRLLLAYHIQRGSQMLEEIQKVKLGDSQNSIETLLKRFGGYRWDVQLGAHEDYNYVLEINPWRFPTLSRRGGRERPIGAGWNGGFRRAIGLRQWLIMSEIAVKNHQVVAVDAETLVEGRTMWLGTSWRLSEKPREFERDPNVEYLQWPAEPDLDFISPGILEMGTGGGTIWEFWIRPSSPTAQHKVADRWDSGCLDSFRGCDTLCDLLPEATRFFSEHSELAPKGGGWDENSRNCLKHDPYQSQYH